MMPYFTRMEGRGFQKPFQGITSLDYNPPVSESQEGTHLSHDPNGPILP